MQFTAPTGYVTRVGGRAPTQRRSSEADDFPPGIRYTGGFGRITRVGGARTCSPAAGPAREATRCTSASAAATRPASTNWPIPDGGVAGCCVPYERRLPGGHRDDFLWSDTDTLWTNGDHVGLQLEHGGSHLGHATVLEERAGVFVDGTIYHGLRDRVKDRHQLSVKVDHLDLAPRRDGAWHVRQARLVEVSLVHSAMWRPLTDAVVWQRARRLTG